MKKVEDETIDTYKLRVFCSNCGYGNLINEYIEIPKGQKFIDTHKYCPNCGCDCLMRV